ncbi:UDP-glucose/GDP-mannose dehydrogenase family protein [Parabacteroides distasonis]|uniref:UDP-glucose dehydrogenase family protein n=1 Tax=Parabacteroides distasonis TaxID=823 RepID=UPI001D106F02|nr:UDP-glucose/GDP-mannose dehydrogenase family protein [Parabacteroides distasonis]MCC2768341.1 UDP-glucose/GDP-mannose dehydrogenase family protein [Parabacteroides distasonis]
MNIAIVGTGYVGLVSGTCFAEMGVDVTCVDVNREKINGLLEGNIPIYEPGLEEMVLRNSKEGRLHFTTDLASCLDNVDIVFSAVGTARKVKAAIQEELSKRGMDIPFDVASNPEFLKEGAAIKDFMSPDRVVVGVESERAKEMMSKLYRPFLLNNFRVIFTDIPSAEMIKYAANSMLATRISFMNDIANLCELVGADVNMVRKGIGSDSRIGNKFLYPGCGYGGSCFPKDVKALIKTAEKNGYPMGVLKAVEEVNERQKTILYTKLRKHFDSLEGRTIALWGLSFKPETDDMREATSLVMIDLLRKAGAVVKVFDPVAIGECKRRVADRVVYAKDMYEAVIDADALLLLTEWKQFRLPSWAVIKKVMRQPLLLDGRNIYDAKELGELGFTYECIGK